MIQYVINSPLAVVISCLTAFPQLFAASARESKPQWKPTNSHYQHLKSRMRGKSARSTDPLYDISAVGLPDQDTDMNSYDEQRPELRPGMNEMAVQYPEAPHLIPTQKNRILRQLEYQVTEHSATDEHTSPRQLPQPVGGWVPRGGQRPDNM